MRDGADCLNHDELISTAMTILMAGHGSTIDASANRDSACFDDPDSFDIRRDPNRHLAFGGGVHHCLGNHLARRNMEIMFNTVLRRLPGLRLAVAADQLKWKTGIQSRGLVRLPVVSGILN